MYCWVVSQFRMKGGGQKIFFSDQRGFAGIFGQHFHPRANVFDDRAADKNHFQRLRFQLRGTKENITSQLPAVSIAQNSHVQQAERLLGGILDVSGKENRTRASAENRSIIGGKFLDGYEQTFFFKKLQLRCAFSAGKNQRVAFCKVGDRAHFKRFRAKRMQHRGVSRKVPLNSQYPDFRSQGSGSIPVRKSAS